MTIFCNSFGLLHNIYCMSVRPGRVDFCSILAKRPLTPSAASVMGSSREAVNVTALNQFNQSCRTNWDAPPFASSTPSQHHTPPHHSLWQIRWLRVPSPPWYPNPHKTGHHPPQPAAGRGAGVCDMMSSTLLFCCCTSSHQPFNCDSY